MVKLLEVNYDFAYGSIIKNETRHVTDDRLEHILACQTSGQYYSNVKVVRDFGEMDRTWLDTWLELGRKNSWIGRATDPEFTLDSFYECKTVEHLMEMFERGNWCLGEAFYFRDLCFINQVDGGDEWYTIRQNVPFESVSCGRIITSQGKEAFVNLVQRMLNAILDDLKALRY